MRRAFALVLLGTFGSACDQKDAGQCDQALSVTRQAASAENFAAAAQWREYAWKQCEDRGTLDALDREIVAKRAEVDARQRAVDERRRQTRDLLKVFLGWVAANRSAPDRAAAAPSCDPPAPNDPKKDQSKDRWCTATRAAGPHALLARYWAAEPALARFSVKLPDVTSCEEIGAPNVLKTWPVAATQGRSTQRFRCEFSTGPLAGMHAVLSKAVNADLYVFNPAYLEKDPALKPILAGP
jgi:hypothetical protein